MAVIENTHRTRRRILPTPTPTVENWTRRLRGLIDRAYSQKDPELNLIKSDPFFKNLKGDPRYKAFLHRMNLPE
jgi:hypothetical protein